MDELIEQLERLTKQMLAALDTADADDMVAFTERREHLVSGIRSAMESTPEASANQKSKVKSILAYDFTIQSAMAKLRDDALTEHNKFIIAKKNKSAYEAAYVEDSYFIDKRK
ncbi:MAG: hypothetical protein J7639_18630 [Paenibacillaceae bacterium]|nr:hypothetical protein [Paenibacillaceae bacterium]